VAGTRATQEFNHQGAINIFSRPHAGYVVTALGEAPASTVMQFANTVSRLKPHH
jgi:negative regulator of sigma E activity